MKIRFDKEMIFNLIYLIPFYLGNKLAQIFRLLQGGDFIDKVIASFTNLPFIAATILYSLTCSVSIGLRVVIRLLPNKVPSKAPIR